MSMGRSKNSLPEQETSRLDAVLEEAWTKINIVSLLYEKEQGTPMIFSRSLLGLPFLP
jgi:hypothetical protein